jgi:hypothetical protein
MSGVETASTKSCRCGVLQAYSTATQQLMFCSHPHAVMRQRCRIQHSSKMATRVPQKQLEAVLTAATLAVPIQAACAVNQACAR